MRSHNQMTIFRETKMNNQDQEEPEDDDENDGISSTAKKMDDA